jgi:hypothetical protein
MEIEDFLIGCLHGIVILFVSLFLFFMGHGSGLKCMEKEAVQKHFGRYDIDTNNEIVFKWNDKL